MTKRDISVIKSAKKIRKYCREHEECVGCVLRLSGDSCPLINKTAEQWILPEVKTYKQDFLSKFPKVSFETGNLCRKMIYGEEHDCCGMTCEECWDEVYMEK